jgi:flagellar hook-associated protein 3 FlgL
MRVTELMMTDNSIQQMASNLEKLNNLQQKVATNKAIQQASDNPSAASQSLTLKSSIQISEAYLDTSQNVDAWMTATDGAFTDMSNLMTKAQSLITGAINDTNSGETRASTFATEVTGMLQQAIDIGNTNQMGNYIFAGNQTKTKPFTLAADSESVTYNGDNGVMVRDLAPGQSVVANVANKADGTGPFTDIYKALIDARDALTANDSTKLQTSLGEIESAMDSMGQYQAGNGARQRIVENATDQITNTQSTLKSLLSVKEDANMAEAVTLLANQQNTYQAVLEVSQRAASTMNLFQVLS